MKSGHLAWFVVIQFALYKGYSCLNTTQGVTNEETFPHTTLPAETPSIIDVTTLRANTSKETLEIATPTPNNNSSTINQTHLEINEIFHGDSNQTAPPPAEEILVNTTTNCLNISSNVGSVNLTCFDQSWNDTFKTNYTTVAEAVGASESFPDRLQNTAAIAAGIFLVSAVIGYFSCVGYRRFLQRKYGNSQILIGEEVYDTTDLRYFEI